MNIFPDPKKSYPYSSYNSFHTDLISLRKDWESIGKDFSNVCKSLEGEQEIFKAMSKGQELIHKSFVS